MLEHATAQSRHAIQPDAVSGRATTRLIAAGGGAIFCASVLLAGCATVKVQAPDKPIEINLNVKIEQEVRVRLDRDIEDLIANNPDIF